MSKRFGHLSRGWVLLGMLVGLATVPTLNGCNTYQDHLNRGQRYYDENEYEKALAIWRALEQDSDSFDEQQYARYAYLRGMTDYRLGYRPHARHWLAIALAIEKKYPGGLEDDWKRRADEALEDLNKDVYGVERFEAPAEGEATEDSDEEASPEERGSDGCRTDSDCPSDQACVSRTCISP